MKIKPEIYVLYENGVVTIPAGWSIQEDYSLVSSTPESRKLYDSSLADVFGGFGTTLYAYGFDLSVAFDYQLGGDRKSVV